MSSVFFFGAMSPYSWFAAERIGTLLPDAEWRPVFAGGLFKACGRVSWGLTEDRATKLADCQARARAYGLGTGPQPVPSWMISGRRSGRRGRLRTTGLGATATTASATSTSAAGRSGRGRLLRRRGAAGHGAPRVAEHGREGRLDVGTSDHAHVAVRTWRCVHSRDTLRRWRRPTQTHGAPISACRGCSCGGGRCGSSSSS